MRVCMWVHFFFLSCRWDTVLIFHFLHFLCLYFENSHSSLLLRVFDVNCMACVFPAQGAGAADRTPWARPDQRESVRTHTLPQCLRRLRRGHQDACVRRRSQGEAGIKMSLKCVCVCVCEASRFWRCLLCAASSALEIQHNSNAQKEKSL